MEKIRWTDRVKNEVLHRTKEDRNTLHRIKRRNTNWIGHILGRNCLLKHFIGGKIGGGIEVMGGRGRSSKQLLDDLKETTGYWKFKEEALDRTVWRTRFGRGFGPVVRQLPDYMASHKAATFAFTAVITSDLNLSSHIASTIQGTVNATHPQGCLAAR